MLFVYLTDVLKGQNEQFVNMWQIYLLVNMVLKDHLCFQPYVHVILLQITKFATNSHVTFM